MSINASLFIISLSLNPNLMDYNFIFMTKN